MKLKVWGLALATLFLASPADAGLQKGHTTELTHQLNEAPIGSASGDQLDTILTKVGQNSDVPGHLFATFPTANNLLQIKATSVTRGDGSTQLLAPLNGAAFTTAATTQINFTTGAITGATVTTDGGAFTLPTVTALNFVRMVIVAKTDGSYDTHFSSQNASQGSLTSAGTLLETLSAGKPIGYIDLQKLSATGFKTATSSGTSPLIENVGIFRFPAEAQFVGPLPPAKGGTGVVNAANLTYGSSNITLTTTGTTSVTLPTSGTLAKTVSDTFTTPTLNSPLFDGSDGSRYVDFSENTSSPSAPGASTLRVYGKSDDNLYFQNSSGTEAQVGSGSGEKNYIQTGSNTAASWTASGAGITVTTDTTAADLPRSNTTKTGIKFTDVSNATAFGYYDFTLDVSDYNTKQKVQFAQACGLAGGASSACVASDFKVDVYSCTVAWSGGTCGGTSTRLALSTDSSAISALPLNTGTYRTTFDAPGSAAKFIQLQVGANASTTHSLVLSDVVVGPGVITQGAALSGWTSFTPSWTAASGGPPAIGNGTITGQWRRIGESIQERIYITSGTTTTYAGSAYLFSLPTGYTVNTSVLGTALGGNYFIGTGGQAVVTASQNEYVGLIYANGTNATTLLIETDNGTALTAWGSAAPASWSASTANQTIFLEASIPINEFAGAGTVNVVQNDCEYASNSSSTDAADSTSFVYGPSGSQGILLTTNITANRLKRVRFLTPVSSTDRLSVEFNDTTNGEFTEAATSRAGSLAFARQSTVTYGVRTLAVSATDVDVEFQQYAYPLAAGYAGVGEVWNNITSAVNRWRLKKCAGGQAVGFATASQTSKGIVSTYAPTVQSSVNTVSSANYTITDTDGYGTILVSTAASDRTITLPAVANAAGRQVTIKKTDSGAGFVVIAVNGGLIDGASSNTLHQQYSLETLMSDGSNWSVVAVNDYIDQQAAGQNLSTTGSFNNLASVIITPGKWVWSGNAELRNGTNTCTATRLQTGVTTSNSAFDTADGAVGGYIDVYGTFNTAANVSNFWAVGPRKFVLTSAQTVYFGEAVTYTGCGGSPVATLRLDATIQRVL